MTRTADFQSAIAKRLRKWTAYPDLAAEMAVIAKALDTSTTTADTTLQTPMLDLRIGPDKTPFTNQILHVVNKGFGAHIPAADMADALGGVAATVLPPVNVDQPLVTGNGVAGSTLSCTMGNWQNQPVSYGYQWQYLDTSVSAWYDIAGATNSTFTLTDEQIDTFVQCIVTATNPAGSAFVASNDIEVSAAKKSAKNDTKHTKSR